MRRPRVRRLEPRNSLHFISLHFYFATVHAVRPCCDLNTSVRHRWNPSCRCSIFDRLGVLLPRSSNEKPENLIRVRSDANLNWEFQERTARSDTKRTKFFRGSNGRLCVEEFSRIKRFSRLTVMDIEHVVPWSKITDGKTRYQNPFGETLSFS